MAEISVDIGEMKAQENHLQTIINRLERTESQLESVNSKISQYLSSQAYQNVKRKISQVSNKVEQNKKAVQSLKTILTNSRQLYQNTENKVETYFGKSNRVDWSQRSENPNIFVWNDSSNILLETIKKLLDNTKNEKEDDGIVEKIKTILKGEDKWADNKEAGIFKDIISYIEDFINFWNGDKKGLTGASDLCKLANSSIDVWKGVYDYYSKMYHGVTTGFFGEAMKKNVGIVGMTGGMFGLLGSILSASTDFDQKKWQSIVANYVDCGKSMISVISSGYQLKHIKDVNSLASIKSGPWSALNLYTAVGDAAVRVISQGFKSHEKYYADGKWNIEDTGATGVDISIAGLYGISHALTLGFDDFIFETVDRISGGNGTDDMSYIEKAAEGWKIVGNEIGKWIANLIK